MEAERLNIVPNNYHVAGFKITSDIKYSKVHSSSNKYIADKHFAALNRVPEERGNTFKDYSVSIQMCYSPLLTTVLKGKWVHVQGEQL